MQISPTKEQVGAQPAMEAMPLVMEPESRFYHDPVLVLDFQSLYPSIVIAYNLCYSTCLGKPGHCSPHTTQPLRFGVYRCVSPDAMPPVPRHAPTRPTPPCRHSCSGSPRRHSTVHVLNACWVRAVWPARCARPSGGVSSGCEGSARQRQAGVWLQVPPAGRRDAYAC